jgi:hypothetical protein
MHKKNESPDEEPYTGWKYFGRTGYDTEKISEFKTMQKKVIPPIEMVAVDGNRVFVKIKGTNLLYFAELMKGNYAVKWADKARTNYKLSPMKSDFYLTECPLNDLTDQKEYTRFITQDYRKRIARETGMFYLGYLLPNKSEGDALNTGVLKYCWPVIVEPFTWYKVKAHFPRAYENKGYEVIDIGVFNLQKLTACQAYVKDKIAKTYLHQLWAKIGSEYHRDYMQPIGLAFSNIPGFINIDTAGNEIMSGGDLRDYGNFVDGLVNYYVLTRQNDKYKLWFIDEQFYFCSNWYKSYNLEEADDYHNWQKRNNEIIKNIAKSFAGDLVNRILRREIDNYTNNGFRIEWREISPNPDPWIWSALESAESPSSSRSTGGPLESRPTPLPRERR